MLATNLRPRDKGEGLQKTPKLQVTIQCPALLQPTVTKPLNGSLPVRIAIWLLLEVVERLAVESHIEAFNRSKNAIHTHPLSTHPVLGVLRINLLSYYRWTSLAPLGYGLRNLSKNHFREWSHSCTSICSSISAPKVGLRLCAIYVGKGFPMCACKICVALLVFKAPM